MSDDNSNKTSIVDSLMYHSKKVMISVIAVSLISVVVIIATAWLTVGNGVVATYGEKKVLKTEYDDAKIKCDGFYQYNKDDQGKKNCSQSEIEDQIFRKALETEAENRGITVTTAEVNKRYTDMAAAYGGEDQYRSSLKTTYNWTPEYVKENFKRDILKEKLSKYLISSRDTFGTFVRYDWSDTSVSSEQKKANEDASKEMLEKNLYPQVKSGATRKQVEDETIKIQAQGKSPWNMVTQIGVVDQNGLNEKTAKERFKGSGEWAAISKLNNVGSVTDIIKSSGGYFVVYRLEKINEGKFLSWDDFRKDAVSNSKIHSVSYKYNSLKKLAIQKIQESLAVVSKGFGIKSASAGITCDWGDFYGRVVDGSNTALAINGVSFDSYEDTGGDHGLCPGAQSYLHAESVSWYGGPTPGAQGGFKIGAAGNNDFKALDCHVGWKIDVSKPGYESIQWRNMLVKPNGSEVVLDHPLRWDAGWAGESYSGPEGIYRTWNTDGNGVVVMKPSTPAPTCTLTQTPNPVTKGANVVIGWTTQNATGGTLLWNGGNASMGPPSLVLPNGQLTYTNTYSPTLFRLNVTGSGGSGFCILTTTLKDPLPGTCPTCNATPSSVRQGEPVTISWSGGTGAVTSLIQNPGASIANPTSGLQVLPSTSTSYSLRVQGLVPNCVCNPVPVIVRPSQSGSDRPVPPN